MSGPGISRRIQDRIDAVFMPSGIRRSVEEIIEIRKAGQASTVASVHSQISISRCSHHRSDAVNSVALHPCHLAKHAGCFEAAQLGSIAMDFWHFWIMKILTVSSLSLSN
ncbi:hypothetical protein Vi05172_g2658 [Venturia inaequalis]|nr:hypothetical protein Vi05172_g2658 [Venturia inaequalis]